MKIIKEIDLNEWHSRTTCPGCHSVLEYNQDDIGVEKSVYDTWIFNIICPKCSCNMKVNRDDLPTIIKDMLWEKVRKITREQKKNSHSLWSKIWPWVK